jgi:CTP:molybdopterin cytidylyltransferase MocA
VLTRVAGVLLAAGEGSRFGQPKALVRLNGMTLAERGVALLRTGGASPVLVVTGAAAVSIDDVHNVYNPDWRSGMGSSLRAALHCLSGQCLGGQCLGGQCPDEQCPDGTDLGSAAAGPAAAEFASVGAAVIALADQPLVGPAAVGRLIEAYRGGADVVVAAYHGQPRNPVLIARQYWAEVIAAATGDVGARPFLRANPGLVTTVECGDTGSPDDVDTPEDLARITRQQSLPLCPRCA